VDLCPVCNALTTLSIHCKNCQDQLEDLGKVADFLDPYGHYNDIETVKSTDGYIADEAICPHILFCNNCKNEQVIFIHEGPLEN